MSNPVNGSIGTLFVLNGTAVNAGKLGLLAVVATVNVADPAALTDGVGSHLSLDATGRLRVVATVAAGVVVSVTPAVQVDGLGATARVVAPGAGAAIVTVAAPPAGTYDVQVDTYYDGAPVQAAEGNNVELREGAVVRTVLLARAGALSFNGFRVFRLVLDGATAVSVNATGAGTAAVGYNAQLILTRVA
jgi:hypothetical protein